MVRLISYSFMVLFLAACANLNGIRSDDRKLKAPPTQACVEEALNQTQNVKIEKADGVKLVSYWITGAPEQFKATVSVEDSRDGSYLYSNRYAKASGQQMHELEKVYVAQALERVDHSISEVCQLPIRSSLISF